MRLGRVLSPGTRIVSKRAFGNLVDNAVKHGNRPAIDLLVQVTIVVADEGPGIPSGALEEVFIPFLRLEPSRSRHTGRIGLGLTSARACFRAHGASVGQIAQRIAESATMHLAGPDSLTERSIAEPCRRSIGVDCFGRRGDPFERGSDGLTCDCGTATLDCRSEAKASRGLSWRRLTPDQSASEVVRRHIDLALQKITELDAND